MSDDIKMVLIIMGAVVATALIIAVGLLLSQWMDTQEVKHIHMYLPGAH